jgi:hypothetical protein
MGWVVSVTPRPLFTPGERTLGTHWTGGWVDPRASLDTEARGKILFASAGDRTLIVRSSSPKPDTILTELPRLLESAYVDLNFASHCGWDEKSTEKKVSLSEEQLLFSRCSVCEEHLPYVYVSIIQLPLLGNIGFNGSNSWVIIAMHCCATVSWNYIVQEWPKTQQLRLTRLVQKWANCKILN